MQGNERQVRAEAANDRRTILLVEDEILVRMMVAEQFRDAGYLVIESANADEAVAVLRSGQPVDLMLSDVRMPGAMDGTELARLVRTEFPPIKIVLASGHLPALEAVEHDGFFTKPYDVDRMIDHVRKLTE